MHAGADALTLAVQDQGLNAIQILLVDGDQHFIDHVVVDKLRDLAKRNSGVRAVQVLDRGRRPLGKIGKAYKTQPQRFSMLHQPRQLVGIFTCTNDKNVMIAAKDSSQGALGEKQNETAAD